MIHESIHAFLLYEQRTNPFEDPFDALNQYARDHGITDRNKIHHEFIPQYIDAMASSLQNWDFHNGDGGNHGWQYYQDMAWGGLTHHRTSDGAYVYTDAFLANNPNAEDRNRIENVLQNEMEGNNNTKGNKCD